MKTQQRFTERGSMFLVALIALSVLTLIGLSLALVTETEMLLGASEWAVTETHFAAEAGINIAMAQLLIAADPSPVDFVLPSYFGRLDTLNQVGFEVKSSGTIDVDRGPLPYSSANFNGGGPQYVYTYTTVRSQRTAWSQGKDVPECGDTQKNINGQKFLMTALYFAPVELPSAQALITSDRAGRDSTLSDDFFCQWEIDQNEIPDDEVTSTDVNGTGSTSDILTKGNPFYHGYTAGS